ncbi:MAG: hypothetical protein PHV33_13305 [Elusimicrobiales bacterium]|nr:hypothetical protein [Elusimicrobiales bacterium]
MRSFSVAAFAAAFIIFAQAGAGAKPPFSQVHNKPAPAAAEDTAAAPADDALLGGKGPVTPQYLLDLQTASEPLRKLDADSRTLYKDQAALIARVETVKDFLDTSASRLGLLETIDADLKATEAGLKAIDTAAEAAEAIPQAREKAKKVRASVAVTLKDVTAARKRLDAVVLKTKPVREKMENAAEKLGKVRLALWGVNEGVVNKMPFPLGIAAGCLNKMTPEKRPCAQNSVDSKAGTVDSIVTEYDRVVKILIYTPEPWLPSMKFFDPFSAELAELEKLREEVDALLGRVEKLEGELHGLLKVLNMKFGFSFPYPNPTWTNPARISHYHVKIGFRKIVQGANAIEKEIEHILSGFLWKVLKRVGVGKYVDDLKDQAEREANRLVRAVHFDIDLGLPDFGPLDAFDASITGLPAALDALKFPVVDTSLPDFGLPGVSLPLPDIELSFGFFSPKGLLPSVPNLCDGVSYGCN